ncbi:OadG family protein [Halopseudomonas salegens]|uniref:Probable oxaloacetate decarboxylase gamma chain n=1 Tax=Halopseudomonas salegens TaxID=1434072 RepID=A0A1H2GDN3_9GAMM|nr:OadG family transporter subunit [Halopseudomonas salegens]SDU17582.1 oxaloacetate decarboxylase, gamma subunit [Halopseudomonas salegens]
MNSSELMEEGVELMLLGMGSVFVFLIMLVVIVTLMSKVLGRYFPEPVAVPAGRSAAKPKAGAGDVDEQTISVIRAAIRQHRARRGS